MVAFQSTIALRTGNKMPVLGLGTWQLTRDTADTVRYALELGYRMIDTSGDYGTQPAIAEAIGRCAISRQALYVVTKVEETDDAYRATQKNLAELELEYVDLMLIHRPPETGVGKELWEGLIQAKRDSLTKDIGVSNYAVEQIRALAGRTSELPVVNQIEWTPFGYSRHMLDFCQENHIIVQAYSPLTRAERLQDKTLCDLANIYGKTPAQLLIRWNLQLGTVPLPKANRKEHLKGNLDVFGFRIGHDEMAELNALNEHYSSLGSLPYA